MGGNSMKSFALRTLTAFFAGLCLASASSLKPGVPSQSEWVKAGSDGKLTYKTTDRGDRIIDFSHAGYMGGGVEIPTAPVQRRVEPSGTDDDTAQIQKAIDEVAKLEPDMGLRGAILLAPGTFHCARPITIATSGIVLRGSGSGVGNGSKTILKLSGRPHPAIVARIDRSGGRSGANRGERGNAGEATGTRTELSAVYVPAGSRTFAVANAAGFATGDVIEIRRPVTAAWIHFLQMHDLVRDGRPQTWMRTDRLTTMERRIISVSGNNFTVDVPLTDSFDAKYLNPPGTAVVKVGEGERLAQVGIEHLSIESPPQTTNHSQPHFSAIRMNGVDCWVRHVVCEETMNSVTVSGRRITLQHVAVHRKARHEGSSKPAEFGANASQLLLDRCTGSGDNIWYAASGSGVTGPIVLLNCAFQGNGRIESHQRWSTGMLYDNCRVPNGGIDFRNRGSMGSGHGWTMGWGVAWNCEARDYVIQNPPGAINWMIGCIGESKLMPRPFGTEPKLAEGTKDSHGTPVSPQSLYLTQLRERLGPAALKNIGY